MDVVVRPWTIADTPVRQALTDDIEVARWMSGWSQPSPAEGALRKVTSASFQEPPQYFAIEVNGELVGGAGIEPCEDTHRGVAIVGYWLGKGHWGRGIATATLKVLVTRAFESGYRRLQASVFEPNIASIRVLEKAGFKCEGRLRASYVQRDGTTCDELIFGKVVGDGDETQ